MENTAGSVGTPGPFVPSADGFAFTNSWPSAPAVTVQTPFGPIGIGNAANGLCGGMVFAALDYWYAGQKPPAVRPAPGSPLYQYIVRRLIDSWHVPAGVSEYYMWMNLPDADTTATLLGRTVVIQRGVFSRTIEQQWPLVKASLDTGIPAPLGVVTVKSASPSALGQNHQVAACSYTASGSEVTVRVYDPNSGQDDNVWITFDTAAPQSGPTSNINIAERIRGFFLTAYTPATPPPPG